MKRLFSVLLTLVLALSLVPGVAYGADTTYSDLPASGWARDAILAAEKYGLMGGMGDGTFGVGRSMTRAEFITVLVRMFRWSDAGGADAFTDIGNSWARAAINTAAANGVVDAGGTFSPDKPITRREMAVMLVRHWGIGTMATGRLRSCPCPLPTCRRTGATSLSPTTSV